MRYRASFVLMVLLPLVVFGCKPDKRGQSSLAVQTTMPEGINVTLVSIDRPGTYVERATTNIAGQLNFIGIRPGRYKLIFQFSAPDPVPTNPVYNYGESDPFEVLPGKNRVEWTTGTNSVTRVE